MVAAKHLTAREQDRLVQRRWPTFSTLCRSRSSASWRGTVRPLCLRYTVNVRLDVLPQSGDWLPTVVVIDPLLRGRPKKPSEPIPHIYPNPDPRYAKLPFLCLYDPRAQEWHGGMAVSKTIIPWTVEWLACYEGWLATGEWAGGGVH